MSSQTSTETTEDTAKQLINEFITFYKTEFGGSNNINNYLTLLNGGVINGNSTIGFLKLKRDILKLMDQTSNEESEALKYIQAYQNNQ
jgi:hypothetical protein